MLEEKCHVSLFIYLIGFFLDVKHSNDLCTREHNFAIEIFFFNLFRFILREKQGHFENSFARFLDLKEEGKW